jgi:[ribosomal protein S5]-alanine N-acetyltransferase
MILLRDYREEDIPFLVQYLNESETTLHLTSSIPQPYSISDAEFWVSTGSRAGIVKAIELDGIYVGDIGAVVGRFERSRSAEIGYWVAKSYWRKGVASTALKLLTNHIFETTDIVRLSSQVFEDNHASCKVLQKCGYIKEATLEKAAFKHGRPINTHLYAKIKT